MTKWRTLNSTETHSSKMQHSTIEPQTTAEIRSYLARVYNSWRTFPDYRTRGIHFYLKDLKRI